MRFLITNDDGYEAPGLQALVAAASALGEVVVVAPRDHVSGCSHRATTQEGLHLQCLGPGRWVLDGTPVDCVRVALAHLQCQVDWVLSGINAGGNLGCDVYLSGTVAAVREAALLGRPGIAVSQYRRGGEVDWDRSARWARLVIARLLDEPLEPASFWNVNFPHRPLDAHDELPAMVHCPLDPHPLPVVYDERDGRLHYAGKYHTRPRAAEHDVDVCFSDRIAVTRLRTG
jgi:5'-nucleotidase